MRDSKPKRKAVQPLDAIELLKAESKRIDTMPEGRSFEDRVRSESYLRAVTFLRTKTKGSP